MALREGTYPYNHLLAVRRRLKVLECLRTFASPNGPPMRKAMRLWRCTRPSVKRRARVFGLADCEQRDVRVFMVRRFGAFYKKLV